MDDDAEIREIVAECLAEADFTVICAADGEQALRYLQSNPPPATIILDLFMPVVDGWEFSKRLQRDRELSSIPVIVMTAAGDHWGCPVPPTMLLRKPLHLDTLVRLVRQVSARGRRTFPGAEHEGRD